MEGSAIRGLPGGELVEKGLRDLELGVESIESLLVSIAAARLARIGLVVADPFTDAEHRLYLRLAESDGDSAHSRYNALVRRLVSFERAAECVGQRTKAASDASWRNSARPPTATEGSI
jgi:hypothetical protein